MAVLMFFVLPVPAQAAHNSSTYAQPVWFEWSKTTLDVLIIPPDHSQLVNFQGSILNPVVLGGNGAAELNPYTSTYLAAIEASIAAWETAWNAESAWLTANLQVNAYVVGRDTIPTSALTDPEIIVTAFEETNAYLGVAAKLGISTIGIPDCVVSNTKMFLFSLTYNDMYNLNAQEYGHCLGLDHVHGELPQNDVMDAYFRDTVGNQNNAAKCISNLNIRGLERVFNGLGGSATISRGSYACA